MKQLLHYISFRELTIWSAGFSLKQNFGFKDTFDFVNIKDILKKKTEVVKIQDDILYQRVTVKVRNNGIEERDKEMGKNIGTKRQFKIHTGQFLLSKIDARNGSMGIVPKELEGAVVTQDFLPYEIETTKVNPDFFVLLTTTKTFIDFCQRCSSGTTNRQRIDENAFLNVQIPLPPISEQNRIVSVYHNRVNLAEQQEKQAEEIGLGLNEYLSNKLGYNLFKKSERVKGLCFIRYKDIEKWGLDFINNINLGTQNKYPIKKIGDVCKISSGGTPSRGNQNFYNGDIPWIKTGELKDDILFDTEEKITELGLKNSSAKLYKKDSIIVAMYGATIGKTAKLGIDATTNQACAVLFNIENNKILTDYLWYYLQMQTNELKSLAYGSAQPNLNAQIIYNFPIPIPDLSLQLEIINKISKIKEQIKELKQQAEQNRILALQEFENEIFKN